MKGKCKRLLSVLVILILVLLLAAWLWWSRPRMLGSFTSTDLNALTQLSAVGMGDDQQFGGRATYSLNGLTPEDHLFEGLSSILGGTRCRPALLNLRPWPVDAVDYKGGDLIVLRVTDGTSSASFTITSAGELCVSDTGSPGLRLYHVDTHSFDQIYRILAAYGEKADNTL